MSQRSSLTIHSQESHGLDHTHSKRSQEHQEMPKTDTQIEVKWDGPEDPANPLNFSTRRKFVISMMVIIATLNVSFASSAPTSATLQIQEEFGVSPEVSYLITSLFLLGYVFGPVVWGPFSEQLGRKYILVCSVMAYSLFIIGQATARNIQTLLITRFLAAFFSSSPLAVSGSVITDILPTEQRTAGMSTLVASVFLGSVAGPIIGGAIVQSGTSWRWIFWLMMIFGLVTSLMLAVLLPETYAPALLRRKAKHLRKTTGIEYYAPLDQQEWTFKALIRRTIFKPFRMLAREPILVLIATYMALIYGVLYAQFEALPLILETMRGLSPLQTGLTFIGVGIGSCIAAILSIYWNRKYPELVKQWRGSPPPEERLTGAMVGAPLVTIGIFWLGWTGAYASVPWYVPAISTIVLGSGIILIFISFSCYLGDAYATNAASAFSTNTMIRSVVAAAFPLFVMPMYTNLGIQWASTLFGCLSILLLPSPFLFKKYGAKIRARSAYASTLDAEIARTIQEEKKMAGPTPENV